MSIITTGSFDLPNNLYDGIWKKIQDEAVIPKLCASEGFKYGSTDVMTFDGTPRAEWVAEGGNKSSSSATFSSKTVATHKAQVTVRVTDEVLVMDEDRQIGILETVRDALGTALGRALDLGAIHRLDPLSGTVASSITDYVLQTTNSVTQTSGRPQDDMDAAAALLIADDFVPNGIALAPSYAFTFKTATFNDGRRMYPDISMNVRAIQTLDGLGAAVSDTVSASKEASTATGVLGVMGDWSAFKWGVVRNIPIEAIEYGDPDGQGDLKRTNQIALRAEAYLAWAVMDTDAFCKIVAA